MTNGKLNHSPPLPPPTKKELPIKLKPQILESHTIQSQNHSADQFALIVNDWKRNPEDRNRRHLRGQESHSPRDITAVSRSLAPSEKTPHTRALTHSLAALCGTHQERCTSEARGCRRGFHRALIRLAVHSRRSVHFD